MTNITKVNEAVTRLDIQDVKAGDVIKFLFLSDIHIDSTWCDRKLLKQHLDRAMEENAKVFVAGDMFDAMQGPKDPRSSYRELGVEYKGNDYFDRILEDAVQFFMPYKDILSMVGYGNHEYSVVRHNGTDLIQRFVGALRREGSKVVAGGYGGFIRVSTYSTMKTPDNTTWMYYNHGAGGDAPVTQGAIQTNRQAVFISGCDVIWNGHNHKSYIMSQSTLIPTGKDNIRQGLIWFLRTPGYKNEMQNPAHGFAASRMMSPTPRGCIWGEMNIDGQRQSSMLFTQDIR